MEQTDSEIYSPDASEWATGRDEGPLYQDNLIFLPFARHMVEEGDEPLQKAA